jgi:DNA-binding MarR family transcriptional regulator
MRRPLAATYGMRFCLAEARMTFNRDRSAGYLATHLARIFARVPTARIKDLDLTTGTFPALLELRKNDGLTQKHLGERLDIEQATMDNTLMRMERDGPVLRKKDGGDRRAQRVWLTHKARDLRDPAMAAAMQENARVLSGLTEDEQDEFIRLMNKVIATHPERRSRESGRTICPALSSVRFQCPRIWLRNNWVRGLCGFLKNASGSFCSTI